MASKYGIAFSKSRALQAIVHIASVHDMFWNYVQNCFRGNKLGNARTKNH
jgi:hypothetical protein